MQLISAHRIWNEAPHNAFTDARVFKGQLYTAFREGTSHVSPDGQLRVLRLEQDQWVSVAVMTLPEADVRDAKLSVRPDGCLMLVGAAAYKNQPVSHQCHYWLSEDGENWSQATPVAEPNHWLWRLTWHGDTAYGMAYGTGGVQGLFWYEVNPDGHWHCRPVEEFAGQYVNEHALSFDEDGTAWCLLRRDNQDISITHGLLGNATPPYTDWHWQDLGFRIGGPEMISLHGSEDFLAAYRRYQYPDSWLPQWTEVSRLNREGVLQERLTVPSGGDCSYPGLAVHEGELHCLYYSSHEVAEQAVQDGQEAEPRVGAEDEEQSEAAAMPMTAIYHARIRL
ncbi:hypothetical protein ACKC9G_04715 [Pokkaliibacter sp. CJK22405]|uniref:hypothetical protein n=1 Tax=Pokkaliibacter sp. CJK22405 TaxID=3384615 RepID=UPI0039852EF4